MDALSHAVSAKITEAFGDQVNVDFIDERGDGRHFFLEIISEQFEGLSRLQRSQMVYKLLDEFMKTDSIHALRMKLKTPSEI